MKPTAERGTPLTRDELLAQREKAREKAKQFRRMDNRFRGGLLGAMLAALPLVRDTALQDQFILPKEIAASFLLALAILWWGWGWVSGRRLRLNLPVLVWAFAAFAGVHLFGWLVAAVRNGSSFGLATDRLLLIGQAFLLFVLFQDFARGRRRYLLALGWLIVLSGFITACWVLYEDFNRPIFQVKRLPDWRGYLSAGLGNTGHIADWIALSFPPALLLLLRVRRWWQTSFLLLHLTLAAAALIVCWSVHSNAGLIFSLLFLTQYFARAKRGIIKSHARRLILLFFLWTGVVCFFTVPAFGEFHPHKPSIFAEAFGSNRWKEGGSTRVVIWGGAASAVFERPILGWGTGNFTYAYPQAAHRFAESGSPNGAYIGQWTNAAHNTPLQIWSELGLPGLAAFAFLLLTWFRALHRPLRRSNPFNHDVRLAAFAMGICAIGPMMMSFPLQLPSFLFFYAAMVALPLCLVDRNRALREERMEFETGIGWLRVAVRGEGMRYIRGAALAFKAPMWGRLALMIIPVGLALLMMWGASNRWRASVWYRHGYEIAQHRLPAMPPSLARNVYMQKAEQYLSKALSIDPTLVDATADRAKLRYIQNWWEGVEDDVNAALPRLQAPKLYYWRGEARIWIAERMPDSEERWEVFGAGGHDFQTVIRRTQPWLSEEEVAAEAERLIHNISRNRRGTLFRGL